MFELIFLLGFTLHNLEEAIWLPAWSARASKFHREVKRNEFHFALFIVTIIGYLITFFHLADKTQNLIIHYAFYGFVSMMCLNVLFPHLLSTVILGHYAPGLLTGLFLNLPLGIFLLREGLASGIIPVYLLISMIVISVVIIPLINVLFKIGGHIIEPY